MGDKTCDFHEYQRKLKEVNTSNWGSHTQTPPMSKRTTLGGFCGAIEAKYQKEGYLAQVVVYFGGRCSTGDCL